ncbi:hypothetical protein HPB52_005500 [Rhipicephalus sanguineus]|uniref:Uncharacterized protein n=1 Tax=Rhipicephalus sanguineus TaxID=34632 RepID=A0A9D4T730_RHISA|nr:hypothetical protein HPB52_005500 [Rhipicephalus sanguineus]
MGDGPVPPVLTIILLGGQEVSLQELSDEFWQSPGLHALEERRAASRLCAAAATAKFTATRTSQSSSSPPSNWASSSPPQPHRCAPLPRLPADAICVVGRPKSPVELTNLQPGHLHTTLLQAACLQGVLPASRDMVRIHPVKNPFTLSVADSTRAQAYLRITSLTVSSNTFTVRLYAPPIDDALRGILYHAFDEQAILDYSRQAIQPSRLWVVAAWTNSKLPRWIFYHVVKLRLLPFRNKAEACFDWRSAGRRTDVCPKTQQERRHRCSAAHLPSPEGSS